MLANFIFSINAVLPLFLLLFLGYFIKRIQLVNEAFFAGGNKLVFYIGLPVVLFNNIYNTDIEHLFNMRFAAFAMSAAIGAFIAVWVIAAFFIKDKTILGAFVQGSFRGNFAFLGMPLLFNLAGDEGLARAALIITFVIPLYNILSVVVLATNSDTGNKIGAKTIAFSIIKNPLIIGVFIALFFVLTGIRLPQILTTALNSTASMATPMALICLGGGFSFMGFDAKFKTAMAATIVKIIITPIVFLSAAYLLGFRGIDLTAIMVMGGVPSAIVGYTMVIQMGGDRYVASTIIVMSILFSSVTLTLLVWFMRTTGLM